MPNNFWFSPNIFIRRDASLRRHDYGAGGVRDFAWETTVGEQRRSNIHISGGVKEDDYVQMRSDRDATSPCHA